MGNLTRHYTFVSVKSLFDASLTSALSSFTMGLIDATNYDRTWQQIKESTHPSCFRFSSGRADILSGT